VLPFFAKSQHLPAVYLAGYSLLAGNWVHAFLGPPSSVATPLWTMSVEEQFYVFWPLVLRTASRASIAKVAIALVIAGNLSRVLLVHAHASNDVITYNTVSCVDPLALGVLIALIFKDKPMLGALQRFALLLFCIGTVISVALFFDINRGKGLVLGRCLGIFASAGIVISCLGTTNYLVCNPVVRYLGKISYGLYVIHMFGWLCAFRVLGISPSHMRTLGEATKVAGVGLALTILFASLSYRYWNARF
jgi:peptidoglycan/LPS O-acetylase OafA/YrhL